MSGKLLAVGRLDMAVERRERLSIAADALKTAYETDSELTAFTTLCINGYRQNG